MWSRLKTIITTTLATLLIGIVIGWTAHSGNGDMPIPSLRDFKYMHIPKLKLPLSHGAITPQIVFVTDTVQVTKLRRDTIYVPKTMPHYVLSDPKNAITTKGSKIDWTAWNPGNHTYQVREYRYHPSNWHVGVSMGIITLPFQSLSLIGCNGMVGYGRLRLGVGVYIGSNLRLYSMLRVSFRLNTGE